MMRSMYSWFLSNMSQGAVCALIAGAACVSTPVVRSACIISWDRSDDRRIDHYMVNVWNDGALPRQSPYRVNAPATQVSCHEVGVSSIGRWQAIVQACLKDGTCSESSKPISFKVLSN
jgi:hypothetical protein